MNNVIVGLFVCVLANCSAYVSDVDLQEHLKAEYDFAYHQYHLDIEYVDDCLYYDDLVCE